MSTKDMITYIENSKEFTDTKLLELISEFSKAADTKSIYKNQLCCYTPAMNDTKIKLRKFYFTCIKET